MSKLIVPPIYAFRDDFDPSQEYRVSDMCLYMRKDYCNSNHTDDCADCIFDVTNLEEAKAWAENADIEMKIRKLGL